MKDDIEQVLHFLLLGILPGVVFGPLAIAVPLIRELTDWDLFWPMKGQWPPGDTIDVEDRIDPKFFVGGRPMTSKYQPLDRVEDLRRDLIWTLSGVGLGAAIQIGLIVWWLV